MPLDPNPLNELGKGTLAPDMEAWLLNHDAVFARTTNGIVSWSRRPIEDCYRDAILALANRSPVPHLVRQ